MGEEMERIRMFNGCLRSIPKFYGRPDERWRNHELMLSTWFTINAVEQFANVDQQKMAILASLAGSATRAIELHGPGKPGFVGAATADAFLTLIRSVFLPRAESNLSRMDFEQYRQGVDEPISEYATTKMALYHAVEPNEGARSYAYLRSEMLRGIYSPYVKNEVIRANPVDEAGLIEAMITALGQAREAYQFGCGVVPNLDGLASTTRMMSSGLGGGGRSQGVEPMEIGAVGDQRTERKCFKCEKPGHFARECRSSRQPLSRPGSGPQSKNQMVCHYCKKVGHKQDDCYKKKREQGKPGPSKRYGVRKTQEEEESEEEECPDPEGWENEETIGKLVQGFPEKAVAHQGAAYRL